MTPTAADLLICAATPLECDLLRARLDGDPSYAITETGVGAVNAAHAVTEFLITRGARAILVCGVGGSYPSSGLGVGDVVCADREIYGDLGATSPGGFLDMQALGFAVVRGERPLFNEIPMTLVPLERRAPFVTVSACTGTDARAREIEARTKGAVENMEGAAIAHVAHLHAVPVGEIRGISNVVTNRDIATWRLRDAAVAAQEAVIEWIARR